MEELTTLSQTRIGWRVAYTSSLLYIFLPSRVGTNGIELVPPSLDQSYAPDVKGLNRIAQKGVGEWS